MKITKVVAKNFQSYTDLEFDYSDLGLSLVSGPTGVGKSTLMDAVSWCLFGETSKDGSADDVRSWGTDQITIVIARVDTPTGSMVVTRRRGNSGISNDFNWAEVIDDSISTVYRGKDAKETQQLLNKRLGVNADLFLMSAYMTQFSKADSFFIASAKDRREVLEKIADQEFAINLGNKASEAKKDVTKELRTLDDEVIKLAGKIEALEFTLKHNDVKSFKWERDQKARISQLTQLSDHFEITRKEALERVEGETYEIIQELENCPEPKAKENCPSCGQSINLVYYQESKNAKSLIRDKLNRAKQKYDDIKSRVNQDALDLKRVQKDTNPYKVDMDEVRAELIRLTQSRIKNEFERALLQTKYDALSWLYDKSFELRGLMMARIVHQVQDQTNEYLEKFFDAALRVQLSLTGSDKLDIIIQNNSHAASFRQLSGGERCMLKLCFSLSIMKAAQNKAGVHFDMIMLDEPLNGLDEGLKLKAFGLLQQLETEYSTVLCIEHSSELKQQFNRVFTVTKIGNGSEIHES